MESVPPPGLYPGPARAGRAVRGLDVGYTGCWMWAIRVIVLTVRVVRDAERLGRATVRGGLYDEQCKGARGERENPLAPFHVVMRRLRGPGVGRRAELMIWGVCDRARGPESASLVNGGLL